VSKAQTVVSLTFDDGTSDQFAVRPMLARHSVHATFFVNTNKIESGPDYLTWEQLSAIAADGNEIGGHTLDHFDLTEVDPAEARRQVREDRKALISRGFLVTGFAYPYGARNPGLYPVIRQSGFAWARRSYGICVIGKSRNRCVDPVAETTPPQNIWAIRTIPSIRTWHTLADLQSVVRRAEDAGGGWVTLVFHRILEGGNGDEYSVRPEVLSRFLDWLEPRQASGTRVRTVGDVVGDEQARRLPVLSLHRLVKGVIRRG
jgi:peptidoglycan/xylan/chitin deacetylase (PgdA/CDA1 family)